MGPGERYLTRADLETVIRRAAEIEEQRGGDFSEISENDVLRIAGEVGLAEENVRYALAEHYAGAGGGNLLSERGWVSKLYGPGLVKANRRVRESAEGIQARLEHHFRERQSLQLVRRVRWGSLWEPEAGVVASVMRSVDFFGRGYQLAKKAKAVEISVVPLDEDSCYVTLIADLVGRRAEWFWGVGVGVGGGLSVAATGAAYAADLVLAGGLGSLAILSSSMLLARAGYRSGATKMSLVLNGILDRLEHDEPLEPPRASWRDLLG